jgi:hypothetical protein
MAVRGLLSAVPMESSFEQERCRAPWTTRGEPESFLIAPIEERTRKEIVTVYDEMVNHMIDIARGKVEGDPKDKAAAVMAFKELTLRVFGKPSTSEEDREAATQSAGIRVVVIPSPELMVKDIIEEKPREQLKPSFIDAEVVSTNSKDRPRRSASVSEVSDLVRPRAC